MGFAISANTQFALLAFGGFLMTCTVGPVAAAVIEVIHPGIRATGASVLSLFQNLFGLALGPLIAGFLSDAFSLQTALMIVPAFSLLAAACLLIAARTFEADLKRAGEIAEEDAQAAAPVSQPRQALA
jgi:MFS family permease